MGGGEAMKYQARIETKFDHDAQCSHCEFRYEKEDRITSSNVMCRLTGKYLVYFFHDPMCFGGGDRKRAFEGVRPEWCPLQRVELEGK
jgi:hypothetical protein